MSETAPSTAVSGAKTAKWLLLRTVSRRPLLSLQRRPTRPITGSGLAATAASVLARPLE